MPTFAISRECDPALSLQEREMLTIQLIIGSSFMPSVHWIRSYAIERPDRLASVCVYEAPTKSILSTFSRCWPVPFTEIREVRESLPDDFVAPESNRAPEGSRLYMIQRQFPADLTEDELGAVGMRAAFCASMISGISWVRSYWDEERKFSRCFYRAISPAFLEDHARRTVMPVDAIDEVHESGPSSFSGLYDGFGLPLHWESPLPV